VKNHYLCLEKINALHFGPFKRLADNIGHELNYFWIKSKILTEHKILRMEEVSLVADLLIAITEGIKMLGPNGVYLLPGAAAPIGDVPIDMYWDIIHQKNWHL